MKTTTLAAAVVGTAGLALAQGVTSAIAPQASAPAGCSASLDGTFEISVAKVAVAKRDAPIAKRAACSGDGILVSTLSDGTLLDAQQRTGYIASNFQFQYDEPAQAGAIYTSGFSACANGSLALGGSAVFYECESGDFFNLYDRNWAAQCSPVEILILPCGGSDSESGAGQAGDGQVVGTQIVTTTIVSALSDGQPQVKTATTGIPLCQVSQISDGQVQVGTTPCASITAAATTSLAPVSQFSDGQIQVTPAASVPTVTSAAATTPAGGAGSSAAASGSSAVLPSETHASGTAATGSGAASTLATSKAASGTGAATSSAGASGTSAPATAAAADLKMSSVVALMAMVGGAVALF